MKLKGNSIIFVVAITAAATFTACNKGGDNGNPQPPIVNPQIPPGQCLPGRCGPGQLPGQGGYIPGGEDFSKVDIVNNGSGSGPRIFAKRLSVLSGGGREWVEESDC